MAQSCFLDGDDPDDEGACLGELLACLGVIHKDHKPDPQEEITVSLPLIPFRCGNAGGNYFVADSWQFVPPLMSHAMSRLPKSPPCAIVRPDHVHLQPGAPLALARV